MTTRRPVVGDTAISLSSNKMNFYLNRPAHGGRQTHRYKCLPVSQGSGRFNTKHEGNGVMFRKSGRMSMGVVVPGQPISDSALPEEKGVTMIDRYFTHHRGLPPIILDCTEY